MKNAIKQFFSSLWEDFVALIKNHFLRLIGFAISFIVPIAVLLGEYVEKVEGKTKWVIPFAVILPLVILLIIYWCKIRRYLAIKVQALKTENNLEKGKHAGLIIICDFIGECMKILPFVLLYILISELQKYTVQFSDILLFMIICESVGAIFILLDTCKNVVKERE